MVHMLAVVYTGGGGPIRIKTTNLLACNEYVFHIAKCVNKPENLFSTLKSKANKLFGNQHCGAY